MSDKLGPVGFVGYGNMGAAIGSGIFKTHDCDVLAVELSSDRQIWINHHAKHVCLVDLPDLFSKCEIIFLAIKPQQVHELSTAVLGLLTSRHILISMLAGVSVAACENLFSPASIVRIMPNTPASVSQGVTGVYFQPQLSEINRALVLKLCDSFGQSMILSNESDINVVTALSGSGPAFFYRMVNVFVDFGIQHGLNEADVKQMVTLTMMGAGHMLTQDSDAHAQINRVASPNGTTEAGLNMMDQVNFDSLMSDVLTSAYDRAISLSKETLC